MKLFLMLFVLITLGFATTASADWKFGLSLGYSPNYLLNLNGAGVSSGTPYGINYILQYQSAMEVGFDIWNTSQNSWGFISGFQYSGDRKLESGTVNGLPVSTASGVSKYQTHFLYVGGAYRWESFYIPLGLTYGLTKMTPASEMNIEVKNGVGALFGIGWFIGDHFVIEYIGRSATTELRIVEGADSENNIGTIGSALLNIKYFF